MSMESALMIDKRVLQLVGKDRRSVDIFQLLSRVEKFFLARIDRRLSRCRFLPLPIMKGLWIVRLDNTYLECCWWSLVIVRDREVELFFQV